jgi:hypothetical protein
VQKLLSNPERPSFFRENLDWIDHVLKKYDLPKVPKKPCVPVRIPMQEVGIGMHA